MTTDAGQHGMDAYLAIVSKRDVRSYTDDDIPNNVLIRILQAGRASGNSRNRQRWQFIAIRNRDVLSQIAATVSAPDNVRCCRVAIAVVLTGQPVLDAGRAAQNMMLAAWSMGIGSCPNTPRNKDECKRLLGVAEDADIPVILSMGYPAEPVPTESDPDAILRRINRKPLDELVRFVD